MARRVAFASLARLCVAPETSADAQRARETAHDDDNIDDADELGGGDGTRSRRKAARSSQLGRVSRRDVDHDGDNGDDGGGEPLVDDEQTAASERKGGALLLHTPAPLAGGSRGSPNAALAADIALVRQSARLTTQRLTAAAAHSWPSSCTCCGARSCSCACGERRVCVRVQC